MSEEIDEDNEVDYCEACKEDADSGTWRSYKNTQIRLCENCYPAFDLGANNVLWHASK